MSQKRFCLNLHLRTLGYAVCVFTGALALLPAAKGFAQTADNSVGAVVGQQAYQMYSESSIESVNVANGNLNLQIPLLSYEQRGTLPPVVLQIVYNADNWTLGPVPNTSPNSQQFVYFTGGGATISVPPFFSRKLLSATYLQGSSGEYTQNETGILDASGAVHFMASTSTGTLRAVDASGYSISSNYDETSGNVYETTLNSNGVGLRETYNYSKGGFISGNFSDPNGNAINYVRDESRPPLGLSDITSYTDSVGRFLPMPNNYQATEPKPGCQTLQYPGPPGSPNVPLTFCYSSYSVSSPFNYAFSGASFVALSSVTLPNGTAWTFAYNQYGDLQTLTYPTGATVTYNWANNGGTTRAIQSRTVNTGQRSDTWKYSYTSNNGTSTVTEADSLGDTIAHTTGGGVETSTVYTDAKLGVVSSTNYVYTQLAPNANGQYPRMASEVHFPTFFNQVRRKAITTLPNGLVKQTCWIYDNDTDTACTGDQQQPSSSGFVFYDDAVSQNNSSVPPTPFPFVLGKNIYQYESDWGQGAPGPWLRTTLTHYKWQDSFAYLSANLLNIPTAVCVPLPGKAACTPSTSDTASYSSYGYDENNGSPQGVFGNQTSVSAWTGSGPALNTATIFNANGTPQSVVDSAGRTTTMSYDGSGAYLSSLTAPATNGVTHTTYYTYDDPSGLLVSTTDENGATTGYTYDSMRRARTVTRPTGSDTYNYVDSTSSTPFPSYTVATSIDSSRNLTRLVNLDGLGRVLHSTLTSDPDGSDVTDTSYDALGRAQTVSNPHRSGSSPTDGATTYSYDVLGRTTSILLPDGNTQSWQYPGNTTLFTNEVGSQWQQTTDALGRLSQVMEPDAATGKPAYETDYSYDLLGNLIRSDQWGGAKGNAGDRVRTFTYDGVSRLLTASLPESGTTTYSYLAYPANSSLCSGTASNVCSRTDARGAVTAYTYDELGRVTSTVHPNTASITPGSTYNYDLPKSGWSFPGQAAGQSNLKGRLSWETNANSTIVYGYDAGGRTTVKSVCTPINCSSGDHYDMYLAYDNLGDVTFSDLGRDALLNSATPNAGYYYGGLSMVYSTAGRLISGTADIVDATHPATIASMSQYNPLGNPGTVSFGGVLNVSRSYSPRGWLTDQTATVPIDNLARVDHYDYFPNGTSKDLVDSLVGTTNYSFDRLNRLTSATNSYTGVTYGYDPWANMTSHVQTAGSGYTYNLQIDANNHIAGLGYDPSGSGTLTADGLNNYSYDGEQRLLQVNGATTYLYDPEGKRVAKQANGAIQEQYLYSPDGTLTTTLGPDSKLIRGSQYGGGEHLADYTAGTGAGGGQTEVRLMDSLGTLFIKLDQAANVLETCSQNAFGESLNCTPGLDYTETHFTDKLRDGESSLDYSGARYYNSTLGRFTIPDFSDSGDPIPYADLSDPQSLNLYTYAGNNPLGNSDPDGHKPCDGNDATSQSAGAGTPCEPALKAPPTTVNVHADLLPLPDFSVLGDRAYNFASAAVQAVSDYATAPRDPGCMAGYAAGGASAGAAGGGVAGGLAGGAGGSLVAPGVGTFGGALAGASEGASLGGQAGFAAGTAIGFVSCYQGGASGGGGIPRKPGSLGQFGSTGAENKVAKAILQAEPRATRKQVHNLLQEFSQDEGRPATYQEGLEYVRQALGLIE